MLLHPEVSLSFWGSYWTSSTPPTPSAGAHIGSVQKIINGPYLSLLNQYRNVGLGRMVPGVNMANATQPPTTPTDADIVTFLRAQMTTPSGGVSAVPPPNANADMVYVVYVPPGSGNSRHSYSTFNGVTFYWAMISDGGYPFPGLAVSHELVETITDPLITALGPGTCEIADACEGNYIPKLTTDPNNGYAVTAYWSAADQKCVIPTEWNGIYKYDGVWTQIDNRNVRQIYSGRYGLIATDTNDAVSRFVGVNNWPIIGTTKASTYAVGDSGVLMLASDVSSVSYYNGTTWSTVGGPSASLIGNGPLYATDPTGYPWQFIPSSKTWTSGPVGGKAVQFVCDGTNLYGLAWDHGSIYSHPTMGSTWTLVGGSADEIFAGGIFANYLAATTLDANKYVALWTGGTSWIGAGGAGSQFALTNDGANKQLYGITPSRSGGVWKSSNVTQSYPTWTQIRTTPTGRIIPGPNLLYAAGGITYSTY